MNGANTNWGKSVAGVVIKDGRVLLCRHTYGNGKDLLIIPGGYVEQEESPEDAVKREVAEETGIAVKPEKLIGARFNRKDWYMVFLARYVSGEARSDGDENSEVLWVDTAEALGREDVPELTKSMIQCALRGEGLQPLPYAGTSGGTLYGVE